MGFWDKVKNFGSKVVSGIRKGWDWAKNKVAPIVRKILPVVKTAAPVVGTAFGRPDVGTAISQGASKAENIMNALHI